MDKRNVKWHQMTADAVLALLHTNASCGLSRKEARSRYRKDGANTIFDAPREGKSAIWRELLLDPAILLLLTVCLLSICFLELWSGLSALAMLSLGVYLTVRICRMEHRLSQTEQSASVPNVRVLRDGRVYRLSARKAVRGDIVLLKKGDIVPADCRLLAASADFLCLTLTPHEDGRALWVSFPKRADRVYTYGEKCDAPRRENMLTGGAEITDGEAVAVVVEIGAYTYLGAMTLFQMPTAHHADGKSSFLQPIRPVFRLYGFFLLILLLPMALVGILTMPTGGTLLSLFLALCALAAVGSFAFLQLPIRRVALSAQEHFRTAPTDGEHAIVKQTHSAAVLAEVSELFSVGLAPLTDGVFRLRAVMGGRDALSDTDAQSLCEAYFVLLEAMREQGVMYPIPDFEELCRTLFTEHCFDEEAMQVRLVRIDCLENGNEQELCLHTVLRDRAFDLIFTDAHRALGHARFFEADRTARPLLPPERSALAAFVTNAERQGYRLHAIEKEIDGKRILLAVAALGEDEAESVRSVSERLRRYGVHTFFFFPNDSVDGHLLADRVGLDERRITKREAGERQIVDLMPQYRVFFGFSESEIAQAVRARRASGKRVAVLGSSVDDLPILHASDLSVGCVRGLTRPQTETELCHCGESDEALRRHSDILMERGKAGSGGLCSALSLIRQTRLLCARIPVAMHFLRISQTFRVALTLFSICFGLGTMTGTQILLGGAVIEPLLVLTLLLHAKPRREKKNISARGLAFPTVGALAVALVTGIFVWCGLLPRTVCRFVFFGATVIVTATAFVAARRARKNTP